MKKNIILITLATVLSAISYAQSDSIIKSKSKSGWKLSGVPVIAYDSDIGLKYGGLVNFYDYGDGSAYPNYWRSVYLEWSRTTKGSGINNILYDDKNFLGTKLRLIAEFNYLIEQNLDFYGFNGYEAQYIPEYEDKDNLMYKSRMYYRHERKMIVLSSDIQGNVIEKKLRWVAGYAFYGIKINSVDIAKLNKGKDDDDKLPSVEDVPGLYEQYIDLGIIPENAKKGGNIHMFKAGVIYDTRDIEACPMKGIWTEALLLYSPKFLNTNYGWTQLVFSHRQYFTLFPKRLSFAYRLGLSAKIQGDMPFYMLPFYYNTTQTRSAFGGAKTIRGVLRNRVVGDAVSFGTLELRWKFIRTVVWKRDFYIALSSFMDAGRVIKNYHYLQPANSPDIKYKDEDVHIGMGGGLRFAVSENFIVAVDYGRALKKQDGVSGLYINLGWLF